MTEIAAVKVKRSGELTVVIPTGTLGQDSTGPLALAVAAVLKTDVKVVVVSMQDVSSLLSEGIRTTVTLRDDTVDSKKEFYICDLPVEVRYTLKITNLLEFLNHVDSLGDILKKYKITPQQLKPIELPDNHLSDADTAQPKDKQRPRPHQPKVFGDS